MLLFLDDCFHKHVQKKLFTFGISWNYSTHGFVKGPRQKSISVILNQTIRAIYILLIIPFQGEGYSVLKET